MVFVLMDFSRNETTVNPLEPDQAQKLVVSGLFRFTRNPMYLGMALVLFAWALYLANASAIIGPVLFVASITALQIKPEEEVLGKIFGQDYADYRKRVRRWL